MTKCNVIANLGIIVSGHTLEELEQLVKDIKSRPDYSTFTKVFVDVNTERGYYDDIEVTVLISGIRSETDEEYSMRAAMTKKETKDRIKQLREELARLENE